MPAYPEAGDAARRRRSRTESASRWDALDETGKQMHVPFPAHGTPRPWEQYTLVRRLGRGSFGQVYEAMHVPSATVVAVKQIHLESCTNDDAHATQAQDLSEIQREITSLAQCASCERVTRYYGSFVKQYTLWVVMELMDAGSCLALLRRVGPLTEPVVAVICRELVLGLEYLHDHGIIHRDIKAANVLLSHRGQVKLADFGVAAQLLHRGSRRNTLVGTPYWMAPEVIKQSHYDARADIWSLGITALELATGHPPLSSYHPMRALFLIPKANAPQVDTSDGKHTAAFARFVEMCLAKRPEDRATAHVLRSTAFLEHAGGLDLVRALLGERGEASDDTRDALPNDLHDSSLLDTSNVSEWVFDISGEVAGGLGVNVTTDVLPAAAALADAVQPEGRDVGAALSAAVAAPVPPTGSRTPAQADTALLGSPAPIGAPQTVAIAATPPTPSEQPGTAQPTTPHTPGSPPGAPARTPATPHGSPRRTPRAPTSPRLRRAEAAQTRVQAALEQLAYQAGQDAGAADTPTTQLYQLHGLLSHMGRQNPEYLEQFVDLLCAPRMPTRAPAAASRLAGLLYDRWLEGLRARWQVLDTGAGPT
ncbi:hypothetical protein MBRA1_001741 [Malassezia brasiliensis]|uniref:non-specific serine/threonine protein kinase n=1 Tax=Malassezia brasiliensis TaxID=1821822 RepID=A0AAF0DS79_9BASI|nr:hypothetical protein MBRA1_001741 [Malassezia brasiliensis]